MIEFTRLMNRAGLGHFFHGADRVSGLYFLHGSGSGYWHFWAAFGPYLGHYYV